MIVGVDDMRARDRLSIDGQLRVVAGNNQPAFVWAAGELNSIDRTGGVPAPIGLLYRSRDFAWFCPGDTIVFTVGDKDAARVSAFAAVDLAFAVGAQVPGHQKPESASGLVDDGRGIAAD